MPTVEQFSADIVTADASNQVAIGGIRVRAFTVPTDAKEADGTLAWNSTSLIVVDVQAGAVTGFGYTYTDASAATLIVDTLAPLLRGENLLDIEACWKKLQVHVRNLGRSGLAATAISAIDTALWDAKAKVLGVPLARLIGMTRASVAIYGSGGFTTYSDEQLQQQLGEWVDVSGCRWVKMKVGTQASQDVRRVRVAREAIGDAGLFVDANGAYSVKQALAIANEFAALGVAWFEEPVSSDDLAGLHQIRERAPLCIDVAAGEYAYTLDDFRLLLQHTAVDVLQADASRCGGVTGFLKAAALSQAFHRPLSAHCAPALHTHVSCCVENLRHIEWFHDHVRIEAMLFDGAPRAEKGVISPDLTRAGCGLALREADARRYQILDLSTS